MIKLKGKYNEAKIFTNKIDEVSIEQVMNLLNQEFVQDSKIRLMPDVHAGAGCTIGTTMTITNKIVPNLVGVDIGCGMECVKIKEKDIDLLKLDTLIYNRIPSGFNIRKDTHSYYEKCNLKNLHCINKVNINRAEKSLGTLGGGNHFIECNKDDSENIYIVVHSGSRRLGLEVAEYYQNMAHKELSELFKLHRKQIIDTLIRDGREKEIEKAIEDLARIPKELSYLSGDLFEEYLYDMKIVHGFAMYNRKAMMDEILSGMGLEMAQQFTTIHNYIDTDNMILRKGAVSAKAGERILIPINMRDGSLICIGKGNEDWNQSAPHGAGRLMSRRKAKDTFNIPEFEYQMKGVYTTSVGKDTLDECPMAYKNMNDIVNNIADTATIECIVKPIYNFKAGGS